MGLTRCYKTEVFLHLQRKYMEEAHDPRQSSKFIAYQDAINLYGWAISQPLPTHGFKWMSDGELEDWKNMPDGKGCILKVDLEYDKELHDLHNDYPLAPENIIPPGSKVMKLIPNLNNKEKYIVHHQTLSYIKALNYMWEEFIDILNFTTVHG